MRSIRLAVDDYLRGAKSKPAEQYMEQQRQALAAQGYYIRKLNQAYFAFYGTMVIAGPRSARWDNSWHGCAQEKSLRVFWIGWRRSPR